MANTVRYRFEAFSYQGIGSRIEIESGNADWVYIHRQAHELADDRREPVMLYVYNDFFRRWDYIGEALPGGNWYDWKGDGPYVLSSDGHAYHMKKGGQA